MKYKRALAILLAALLLLPCFLTAASAAWTPAKADTFKEESFHPEIYVETLRIPWEYIVGYGAVDGWVQTKAVREGVGATTYIRTYDQQGRLLKEVREYHGMREIYTYTYDDAGLLIKGSFRRKLGPTVTSFKGEMSHTSINTYDADGRLKKTVTKSANETGAVSKVVEAYAYDAAGRMKKIVMQQADATAAVSKAVVAYAYDKDGNQSKITAVYYDAAGAKVGTTKIVYTRTCDETGALRKLTRVTKTAAGSEVTTVKSAWSFDQNGNLIKAVDNEKKITGAYAYDSAGHLIKASVQNSVNGTSENVSFSYDRNGHLAKSACITDFENGNRYTVILSHAYDNSGNLKKAAYKITRYNAENDQSSTRKGTITFKCDKAGNLLKVVYTDHGEPPVTFLTASYQKIGA